MILVPLVLLLLLVLVVRRARRKATLAGLVATRPVFSLTPPTRRVDTLKRHGR